MQPPTQQAPARYRPDIDGLRAIAIMAVVFYHAGFPGFSGGFVGVDVFFVISGFLITALLFNEAAATGRVSLSAFYARRVRRLMPAGLLVVAATLLLGALFMPPVSDEQRALARSAMAVAFFASNFYFFATTGGYFDAPSFSMPLLHTWSLAVEEQYYLLWPLLMLLLFRLSRPSSGESTMRTRVLWALAVMLAMSLALSVGFTGSHQDFSFYLLPARVWEFAIGGIVGLAGTAFYHRLRRWGEALAGVGLALIAFSVGVLDDGTPFPGSAAALPVFGAALLIVGMTANEQGRVRRLLASRPMVFVGLLSYSWYLWHWPLLSFYRIHGLGIRDLAGNAVVITVALILAWLTYIGIEHPVRTRRPWLFASVRPTLFAGAAISLATLFLAAGLWGWREYQKSADAYSWIVTAQSDHHRHKQACSQPARPVADLPLAECTYGPDRNHPKLLLWGDSHAMHLLPMLTEAFPEVAVYELTMATCVPLLGDESRPLLTGEKCLEFNRRVLQEIIALKNSGLEGVVMSARWPMHFAHQSIAVADQRPGAAPPDATAMAQRRTAMQRSLDVTLTTLERLGLRVVVLAPTPQLLYSAPQCVALRGAAHCNVPRARNEFMLSDSTEALAEVISRHPNTRLIEPVDFFCDAQTCLAVRDGRILYYDDDHITTAAAHDLGRYLAADLAWLLDKPPGPARISQETRPPDTK
ncbi:acyltransferase family protein [Accumulibacter sp.]|uniref:acyltransferase family protein n=1 Tax=Accumulibacter sp. TaxID=2053492 RepID=UPI001D9BBBAC|nr:acyltransferase family protein [Accumulibacter sp.]MCB1932395.1 acyltransferase [Accumulibacter sp.]MCP5227944.1 acyltransferase [Accumulibacter sp.]